MSKRKEGEVGERSGGVERDRERKDMVISKIKMVSN